MGRILQFGLIWRHLFRMDFRMEFQFIEFYEFQLDQLQFYKFQLLQFK
jgi:hypothetical protein